MYKIRNQLFSLFFYSKKNHDPDHGYKCGVCGDSLKIPTPRPNENGGKYSRTVDGKVYITQEYVILIQNLL